MNSMPERKSVTLYDSDQIVKYIENFEEGIPLFIEDLYKLYPNLKKGNIRQIIKRLFDKGIIERAKPGVYFKPKSDQIVFQKNLSPRKIIESKYLRNGNKIIGYRSGINFSNLLGLTTQIANVELIISNAVSNKKRKISISKGKILINAPRIQVDNKNYKLLQILDLMNDFEIYSEFSLEEAAKVIEKYLSEIQLTKVEIDECMNAYPLQAQVNFYRTGVYYEITNK